MDIFNILAKAPNRVVQLEDDDVAKVFLGRLGIADAFSEDNCLSDRPTTQICGYDGHKTHFIVGFRFSGLRQKRADGYVAVCIPKNLLAPALTITDLVMRATREKRLDGLRVVLCALTRGN